MPPNTRIRLGLVTAVAVYYVFPLTIIDLALLMAMFVWVPALLSLVVPKPTAIRSDQMVRSLSERSYPFALISTLAFILPEGNGPLIAAAAWFFYTALIGCAGLLRQLRYGFQKSEEVIINLAMIYLPVGGAWLLLGAGGFADVLPYTNVIVWLTAVHFHYAAFILLAVTGLYVRSIKEKQHAPFFWPYLATLLGLGPLMVAFGIMQGPPLEFYFVIIYGTALVLLALWWLGAAFYSPRLRRAERLLWGSGGLVFLITTSFAVTYSFGLWQGTLIVDIPWMVNWHGAVNALIFTTLIVIASKLAETQPALSAFVMSDLRTKGYVGKRPLEKKEWKEDDARAPALIADWEQYRSAGFEPADVAQEVKEFYTDPTRYKMRAFIQWGSWTRPFLRFNRAVTRRMGQLNVPIEREVELEGTLAALSEKQDRRPQPSAWLRWRKDTKEHVFTAIYSTDVREGYAFMNIALPLARGVMVGVLRPENDKEDGLWLTSRVGKGGEGIYITLGPVTVRTPLVETFHVWKGETGTLYAVQELKLWRFPFLKVEHELKRKTMPSPS